MPVRFVVALAFGGVLTSEFYLKPRANRPFKMSANVYILTGIEAKDGSMSDQAVKGQRTQAERTLAIVREGLARRDTACVTQVLEIIQQLSGKVDHLSVQDFADIVGRDLTAVTKIMRVANCLGYNPTGADVTTLPEAISVIGFENIRNLVISLLLMENSERRGGRDSSRDVSGTALGGALLAQVLAQRVAGVNAEQAFVAGALRHYGKLLLSTFLPDDYLEAAESGRGAAFDSACEKIFGVDPLEVGRRILGEANLPKLLRHSLDPASSEMIRSKKLTDPDRLLVVTDFAGRVAEMLNDPAITQGGFNQQTEQMLADYSASVELDKEGFHEVLAKVSHVIGFVGQAQGVRAFESGIARRLHNMAEGRPWPKAITSFADVSTEQISDGTSKVTDPFAAGLAEVERLVHSTPLEIRRVLSAAARCLKLGLGLRSCVVFVQDASAQLMAAEAGTGPMFHEVREQSLINAAHADVFSVCVKRGEDVLIRNPGDANIAPFIPNWFKSSPAKGPLALFPVKDFSGTFAVFCCVVGPAERIELTASRLQQLKKLRGYLAPLRDMAVEVAAAAA